MNAEELTSQIKQQKVKTAFRNIILPIQKLSN